MWSLRDQSHIDLRAMYPNSPVFLHLCTSGKKASGKGISVIVTVLLTPEAYTAVRAHIEDFDSQVGRHVPLSFTNIDELTTAHHG